MEINYFDLSCKSGWVVMALNKALYNKDYFVEDKIEERNILSGGKNQIDYIKRKRVLEDADNVLDTVILMQGSGYKGIFGPKENLSNKIVDSRRIIKLMPLGEFVQSEVVDSINFFKKIDEKSFEKAKELGAVNLFYWGK